MRSLKRSALVISIALAAGVAQAQSGSTGEYSKDELRSFAVALLEVRDLNRQMLEDISRAKTPEDETVARSEAQQSMVQAVQENGLSVEQYNRISKEVQTNPRLAERVQRYMQSTQ